MCLKEINLNFIYLDGKTIPLASKYVPNVPSLLDAMAEENIFDYLSLALVKFQNHIIKVKIDSL